MQEKPLKFSKRRLKDAPDCPCGEPNSKKNPQFAPFEDCEGKYGYCHRCDRDFMPGNTEEVVYTYTPVERAPQQFLPEIITPWVFPDTSIEPVVADKSKQPNGSTVTFYYRNAKGKITAAKQMVYNFNPFKRDPAKAPLFTHQADSGYYHCLFYEYHLTKYPAATVILVESEKTACLMTNAHAKHLEEFIYLATGGSNGLTDAKAPALKGRTVLICYDCDQGDTQPDGTIKSPKGREAAQTAYLKLIPFAAAVKVVDADPTLMNGEDLADLKPYTIDRIRALAASDHTKVPIPPALIATLRKFNRDGLFVTDERLGELGHTHGINADRILLLNRAILQTYAAEANVSKAPLVDKLKHWLTSHYEFRRNAITSMIQMKSPDLPWEDINTATIWCEINSDTRSLGKGKRGGDLNITRGDIENILESDFVADFNPFVDYFEALPPWDGIDHITKLADHITTDNQPFWRAQLRKALIRMIACSLPGEHQEVNRIVITLVSETQNIGKSKWIRFLCPPQLRAYYKEDPMLHDKDAEIALSENFIWNLEELDDLTRRQISEMKAIISKESVKQRRAYARYETHMRRVVNFWGSTNKTDFLSDTSNTRWLCINVAAVNHDYHNTVTGIKNVSIDKVYSQAYHLYKAGESFQLDTAEREVQEMTNKNFETMPEEKQLIIRYISKAAPGDPTAEFMQNFDIRQVLVNNTGGRDRFNEHNIGRAMKQLGFVADVKKINGKTARGYFVKVDRRPTQTPSGTVPLNYQEPDQPVNSSQDLPF